MDSVTATVTATEHRHALALGNCESQSSGNGVSGGRLWNRVRDSVYQGKGEKFF